MYFSPNQIFIQKSTIYQHLFESFHQLAFNCFDHSVFATDLAIVFIPRNHEINFMGKISQGTVKSVASRVKGFVEMKHIFRTTLLSFLFSVELMLLIRFISVLSAAHEHRAWKHDF